MNDFKRLVSFGCSHTAGDELSDHTFLGMDWNVYHNECRALHNDRKLDTNEKILAVEKKYWSDSKLIDARIKANRNLSWSSWLSKRLDLPHVNISKGGSAMSHIFYDIVDRYHHHSIHPTDIIVIGMTHVQRYVTFRSKVKSIFQRKNSSFAHSTNIHSPYNLYNQQTNDFYNLEKLVWEYYNTLKQIEQFGQQNNLTIMLLPVTGQQELDPFHPDWLCESKDMPIFNTHAKWCWKTLQKTIMVTNKGLEEFNGTRLHSGFGHYVLQTHQDYADHVYEKIIQRKIISR